MTGDGSYLPEQQRTRAPAYVLPTQQVSPANSDPRFVQQRPFPAAQLRPLPQQMPSGYAASAPQQAPAPVFPRQAETAPSQPIPVPLSFEQLQAARRRSFLSRLLHRWYSFSAPDERDAAEHGIIPRGRLASIILLIALVVSIAFVPAALTSDSLHVLAPDIGLFLVCCIAIPLNKRGYVTLVGVLIVAAVDIALIYSLLSYPDFRLTQNAVPIYDLFVLADLIAVSLLPINSIIYVSLFHSLFMCADIAFQPHTADLGFLLTSTDYSIMVRPLTIQIVVALITYLWVRNTLKAMERANRAEVIAQLERTIARQKIELDEGIQQVLYTLVRAANGDLHVRTPLAREHVLWQVDIALNTLLSRLQRANLHEQELQKIKLELGRMLFSIRDSKSRQAPLWLMPGGTELDPLISELLGWYLLPSAGNSQR
jgi:hypothetical protein